MDGPIPTSADILIAGGGTTGLVVATRLAKADPTLSIVVLESGIGTRDNPLVVNPGVFLYHLVPHSTTATFYVSKQTDAVAGRNIVVPMGGCLGGGSSINFMVYVRPQAIDFDDWNAEGWSGERMTQCLKKFENFQDESPGIDKSVHGYGGEISVSAGSNGQPIFQDDFFKACEEVGIKQIPDVHDLKASNGVGKWNKWIDAKTGLRQDVAHRFLYPLLDENVTKIHVMTQTRVTRVLFNDDNEATGLEYVRAGAESDKPATIKASKLVVLAGGALSTPQILQRSGVGEKGKLSKLGVNSISDLPGVGTNYQDHNGVFWPYRSTLSPEQTLDGIAGGRLSLEQALMDKNSNPGQYLLGWNGLDCFGKIRPSEEDIPTLGPELRELWERDYHPRETRPLMLICTLAGYIPDPSIASRIPVGQYFCVAPYNPYPYSRGYIHITGTSINDPPDFNCGFLEHPADVQKLIWGYKKQREIARRMSHYRGALEIGHPIFPENSTAGYESVDRQSEKEGKLIPIVYSKDDDNAIETFIRHNVQTTWHSMGTCAMKPREVGGVVDKCLNVYGVSKLKVVDLSICPSNVAANTYSTALAVGENAASIIARDLGIPYSF